MNEEKMGKPLPRLSHFFLSLDKPKKLCYNKITTQTAYRSILWGRVFIFVKMRASFWRLHEIDPKFVW